MSITLEKVAEKYLVAKSLADGTRKEYRSTVTKWVEWGQGVTVDQIERHHIRDYLDWVHEKAANNGGSNAGRTANKARHPAITVLIDAFGESAVQRIDAEGEPP